MSSRKSFALMLAAVVALVLLSAQSPKPATPKLPVSGGMVIGELRTFAFDDAGEGFRALRRQGWLPCDGREYNVKDYPKLHEVIGDAWGATVPKQTFRVPDLRGMFLRGWTSKVPQEQRPEWMGDATRDDRIAMYSNGATANRIGSYQRDQGQSHKHSDKGHIHPPMAGWGPRDWGQSEARNAVLSNVTDGRAYNSSPGFADLGDPVGSSQGDARHGAETRAQNVNVMFCIYSGKASS